MINKDILYRGTMFEFKEKESHELTKYILADCHEEDFVFQIICIAGYMSGSLSGYVKKEDKVGEIHRGITKKHLMSEIQRNFLNVQEDSIKIYSN